MGHTVTGKLNKAAREFAAGESLGFGINVGVKYYDRTTKQNEWTNYKAVIFSKNQSQIDFLRGALVEGSVVELFGESIKVDPFVKDDGSTMVTLELNSARLGYVGTVGQAPQQQAQGFQPQQQAQGFQPQQQAPQQQMQQSPQQPGFNQQQPNPNQWNR